MMAGGPHGFGVLFAAGALVVAASGAAAAELTLAQAAGYQGVDGARITPQVVVFDPRLTPLRVLSVPAETKASESTLRDLARRLGSQGDTRKREWALINGGFSSFHTDVPLGLLVVDGKVLGTLARERASGAGAGRSSGEYGGLRWSGLLCQLADGGWRITPASRYVPGQCRQALQSGPVLVEPGGRVGIRDDEPTRSRAYVRSAVCLLADGRMQFVVAPQPTHLLPFARWLAQMAPAGGGCDAALNLSGDTSSGLYVHAGGKATGTGFIGPGNFPLPSALLVRTGR